jgi:hypothetical protein
MALDDHVAVAMGGEDEVSNRMLDVAQDDPARRAPPRPDLSVPGTSPAVEASGTFRKKRIKPLERYGAYRGAGTLRLDDGGIHISGKHVLPLGARWGIGLAICIVVLVATRGTLILGLIPIYLLVEYVILQRGDATVPWNAVSRYAMDERRRLVAIDVHGRPRNANPIVMETEHGDAVLRWLHDRCHGRMVAELPATSRKRRRSDP